MQERDSDGAKQDYRQPVEQSLHLWSLSVWRHFGKGLRLAAAITATGVSAGCDDGRPTGQVLASIEGAEVTQRELQQEMRSAERDASVKEHGVRVSAMDELVVRKILSTEAEKRQLSLDAEFHFALRRSREQLLVDALRRQIREEMPPIQRAQIQAYIASQPWRFQDRAVYLLEPVAREGSPEGTSGEAVLLDTIDLDAPPPANIATARTGAVVNFANMNWTLRDRRVTIEPYRAWEAQARKELAQNHVADTLRQIVANYRQSGRIKYQEGMGPSHDGALRK